MEPNKAPFVHHITPYLSGDIGKGINTQISHIPDDDWICLRDNDTLFLHPHQAKWIEDIVKSNPSYDVIGCSTNRLASTFQLWQNKFSEETDITSHQEVAIDAYNQFGLELTPVIDGDYLAGLFYLFRKSLWNEIPFEDKSIQFDLIWCEELYRKGKSMAICRGLYLFHLYRMGSKFPPKAIGHIKDCQDMSKAKSKSDFKFINVR